MRRRTNLLLYLLLNIIVSAATTLAVLAIWDQLRPPPLTRPVDLQAISAATPVVITAQVPTATLPPVEEPLITIVSVIGPGDLNQEVVMLRRAGVGNLLMTGWVLQGSLGSRFTFPPQPELTLYKDGAMQVYTRAGDTTATDVFWGQPEPAWHPGETVILLDREGNQRAEYTIP